MTVSGKYVPPLTVASLATITHSWPSTTPMPGDDSRRRGLSLVHVPRGQGAELEERAARIEQPVDSLPRGQLAARAVPFECLVASTARDERGPLAHLGDERLHPVAALGEELRIRARPAT